MINFGRSYEFTAGVPSRPGFSTDGLRVVFNIEKASTTSPSSSKITIFNLAPEHLAILSLKDCAVELKAGYGGVAPVIGKGDITRVVTSPENADRGTEIEFVDSRVVLRDSYVNVSYSGTINRYTILNQLVNQMGVILSLSPDAVFGSYRMGFSFIGLASTSLKKICAVDNLRWSMQNGILEVVPINKPFSQKRIFKISFETGLIGIPEAFTEGSKSASPGKGIKKAQKGWRVKILLNPYLGIHDYVYLESNAVKGYFWVNKLVFSGDTHGDEWICTVDLLEPGTQITNVGEGYAK